MAKILIIAKIRPKIGDKFEILLKFGQKWRNLEIYA